MAQSEQDTILLSHTAHELTIVDQALLARPDEQRAIFLNLGDSKFFRSQDLATFLDRKGLAQISAYGAPGTSASIRFRGTSSDQTALLWQGLPVNSVSLGSADISLIPVFLFEQVAFNTDPDATSLPGTSLGAAIELSNNNLSRIGESVKLFSSYNSLHNSFSGIDIALQFPQAQTFDSLQEIMVTGKEKSAFVNGSLNSRTKVFYQDLRNDFSYTDKYDFDKPVVRQTHNNGMNYGALQDLSWKWGINEISGHLWYQQRNVELPGIMGKSAEGTSEQDDEFLRTAISFSQWRKKLDWKLTAAWLDESQYYRDLPHGNDSWGIDSRLSSKVLLNTLNIDSRIAQGLEIKVLAFSSYTRVNNVNYTGGEKLLWWGQAGGSLKYVLGKNTFKGDVRMDIREVATKPAWTLAYLYTLNIRSVSVVPEVQTGRRFRVGDFNERFWVPGGNPDLLPEQGMNYKASLAVFSSLHALRFRIAPNIFYSDMTNLIQWVPGAGNIWSPVNLKHVRTRGLELPARISLSNEYWNYAIEGRYSHTIGKAVNNNTWNDAHAFTMIYTPVDVVASEASIVYKHYSISFSHKYTSLRYTDEQNAPYRALQPYQLFGCQAGYRMEGKRIGLYAVFSIDNLTDEQYESVRSYAMPGRVYQLNLQLEFKYIKQQLK